MVGGTRGTKAQRTLRALFVVLLVVGLASIVGAMQAGARAAQVHLHKVGDFSQPVFVDDAPGAKQLLFVVQKAGSIAVLKNGDPVGHDFLDISGRVSDDGERGLLSVAFDPNYDTNRRFYVYYANNKGDIEIDGFRRSADSATRANRKSREKIIVVNKFQSSCSCRETNHNGGQAAFGPDGHLYFAPGDGGTGGDPENDSQRKDSLLGKVLRIDPKAGGGYTVPNSNPFVGRAGRDEIFSLGLRNPFRFSFDSNSGDLWIGDVGASAYEEIDHVTLAHGNGANFGWNQFEGPIAGPGGGHTPANYVPPVHSYPHSGTGETGDVIIGGYVDRDPKLPSLEGDYLYSDNQADHLRAYDQGTDTSIPLGVDVSSPSSFGEGRGGRLYVASLGDGGVYRILAGP
jgi:glucose/arabinose dehydrogenase